MKGEPEFARLCLSISTGIDEEASFPHSPRQVPGDLLLRAGPLPRSRGRLTLCPLTLPGEGEGSVPAVEEGEVEHHEVAVGGEDDAHHRQDEAEGEDQARAGQDGYRRHHDGDLEQRLAPPESDARYREGTPHRATFLFGVSDSGCRQEKPYFAHPGRVAREPSHALPSWWTRAQVRWERRPRAIGLTTGT